MKQHYAVVADGKVVNVAVWDGTSEFEPGDGVTLVPLTFVEETDEVTGETVRRYTGGIGWSYADGVFVDERPVEVEDV